MKGGFVQLHKRKRKDLGIHKHAGFKSKMLDKVTLVAAFIFPFTTVPQIVKIWASGTAEGLSLVTWVLYFVLSIPFLAYGVIHEEKPLVIMYSLWLVVHASVITGILLYS